MRARILEAMLTLMGERGFARTTVRGVTVRAGVSTATFYEQFDGLEDCLTAVLDLGLDYASDLIARAFAQEHRTPQDALRAALASLLVFLDSEPALTRAWFIDSLAAGRWALQRREHNTRVLLSIIAEPWQATDERQPESAVITGVMASVFGLIHSHLITERPEPLVTLLGPLMGVIVSPFLDASTTGLEIERAAQLACSIEAGKDPHWRLRPRVLQTQSPQATPATDDATLRAALRAAGGTRARECLLFLAGHPGASNRELAAGICVAYKSQMSRLLAGLQERGLVVKHSEGVGRRNAWHLTKRGEAIVGMLVKHECPRSVVSGQHEPFTG